MSANPPNRRTSSRVPPGPATAGLVLSSIAADCVEVEVRNICSTGVGLLLDQSIETTEVQGVILFAKNHSFSLRVSIKAVYCVDGRDGRYILGAKFLRELTDEEIKQLTS
jgi:hypothetical protein